MLFLKIYIQKYQYINHSLYEDFHLETIDKVTISTTDYKTNWNNIGQEREVTLLVGLVRKLQILEIESQNFVYPRFSKTLDLFISRV